MTRSHALKLHRELLGLYQQIRQNGVLDVLKDSANEWIERLEGEIEYLMHTTDERFADTVGRKAA